MKLHRLLKGTSTLDLSKKAVIIAFTIVAMKFA